MRGRKRALIAASLLASTMALGPSCSLVAGHSNGGIALLEEAAAPVRQVALAGKYLGWLAGFPGVIAMVPVAAIAWATPWVDLTNAIDLCSAPSLGLGYLMEAVLGFPTYGAFYWAEDRAGQSGPRPISARSTSIPGYVSPPAIQTVPWGFVVDHHEMSSQPRAAEPPPPEVLEYYAIPEGAPERLAAKLSEPSGQASPPLEMIGTRLEGIEANLELYPVYGDLPKPVVLITPPTKAIFATRYLARRFQKRGFHAAVVVPDSVFLDPELDAKQIETKLRATVVSARTVVSALLTRPDIDRVLYLGISAGGVFGSMLMGVEPRVERAVLVLPGGDMPHLIATSNEKSVTEYREAWEERGVDARTLSASFSRELRTEPLLLAKHVDPRRVLLFLGAWDTKVPTAGGIALGRALGSPETYLLAGNHETASLCFGFVLREADEFLFGD